MKKITFICVIAMAALSSCVAPFEQNAKFIDYSAFPDMFITESNSVNFEYQPIASIYVDEVSGEYKQKDKKKKKSNNEVYGDEFETGPGNYRFADPQSALNFAIEKARLAGGNGIINLKIDKTRTKDKRPVFIVTGMVIKRK